MAAVVAVVVGVVRNGGGLLSDRLVGGLFRDREMVRFVVGC